MDGRAWSGMAVTCLVAACGATASSAEPMSGWSWAIYGGGLTERPLQNIVAADDPWLVQNYIVAASLTYQAYRFSSLPLILEFDATVAKRFGEDHEWEFAAQPVLRWTAFPWNHLLYTNLRIAPIGLNYATGVSPWELHWAENDHGSRLLNFLTMEVTFKTDEAADTELFVKTHHRSGIFGLINDTYGGSTYITGGFRRGF